MNDRPKERKDRISKERWELGVLEGGRGGRVRRQKRYTPGGRCHSNRVYSFGGVSRAGWETRGQSNEMTGGEELADAPHRHC